MHRTYVLTAKSPYNSNEGAILSTVADSVIWPGEVAQSKSADGVEQVLYHSEASGQF